jgi:hypothetical protein
MAHQFAGLQDGNSASPNRMQAEVPALPLIAEHEAVLLAARSRLKTTWRHELKATVSMTLPMARGSSQLIAN